VAILGLKSAKANLQTAFEPPSQFSSAPFDYPEVSQVPLDTSSDWSDVPWHNNFINPPIPASQPNDYVDIDTLSSLWNDIEPPRFDAPFSRLARPYVAPQASTTSDSSRGRTPGIITPSTSSSDNSNVPKGGVDQSSAPVATITNTLHQLQARANGAKARTREQRTPHSAKRPSAKKRSLGITRVKTQSACIRCQAMHESVCLTWIIYQFALTCLVRYRRAMLQLPEQAAKL
jgi:hypothetical protein